MTRKAVVSSLVLAAAVAAAVAANTLPGGPTLSYHPREAFEPNGFVRILVPRDGAWVEAARVAADEHLRTRTVDLASWATGGDLVVRLEPVGAGASHLDAVLLGSSAPAGLGARLARKLAAADNDVADFAEVAGLDLVFGRGASTRLALTARIEPAVLGTEPVSYPGANTWLPAAAFASFLRYRPGTTALAPTLDGSIAGEPLGEPFLVETFRSGTGHPDSPTWAWVGDDGRSLFALLDVTADNTLDAGKDYARLHVRTAHGVRTFEVSSRDGRWGRAGFEYTDRVGWEHKVYEIAVPLAQLDAGRAADLELAFSVYGTYGPPAIDWDLDANGVDPDSGASGTTFTFTVEYTDPNPSGGMPMRHDVWIDLDGDGVEDAGVPVVPGPGGPWPWIAAIALAAAAAIAFLGRRRALPRIAALAVAVAALATCAPPTTQEVYEMTTGDANWVSGLRYSVEVPLVAEAGSYDFAFVFTTGAGDPVAGGPAAGTHALVVE